MGGIKGFDSGSVGKGISQGALFKGFDQVFADLNARGVSRDDLSHPKPAGDILRNEVIEPKSELLGDHAVALVVGVFPGAEIVGVEDVL